MADYGCYPLWDAGSSGPKNLDPSQYPISEDLRLDFARWAERYDRTLVRDDPSSSGFETYGEHFQFVEEGRQLAVRLANELGAEFTVLYFDDLSGKTKGVAQRDGR